MMRVYGEVMEEERSEGSSGILLIPIFNII